MVHTALGVLEKWTPAQFHPLLVDKDFLLGPNPDTTTGSD
jgi:hypothetical protein